MITGKTLRDAIISGANNIANQRTRVDELNVFPVPDGDTGTNMSMTIGAALSELNAMPDTCTVAEASKSAASAMLRGARGNSGVITSLLFRGFSKALAGKTDAEAADLAKALQMGVEAAYKAVMKPTEGTILTVTRLAAEAAVAAETNDVPQLWATVCEAGQKALEDTPNLLPVLKRWESSAERVHLYAADAEGIFLIPPSGHSPAFCRRKQGFFAAILTQEGGDTQPRYDSSYHIFRENHVNRRRFFVMKRLTAMFLTLLLLLSLSACGTASQNQTDNTDSGNSQTEEPTVTDDGTETESGFPFTLTTKDGVARVVRGDPSSLRLMDRIGMDFRNGSVISVLKQFGYKG